MSRSPSVVGRAQVDPRGPQLGAGITSVLLMVVLLTAPGPVGVVLIALQTALFAVAVTYGVQASPWAVVFRRLVRPRLGAPAYLEDAAPPRFAQGVGLVFAVVALIGYLAGPPVLGAAAAGLALVAALLNAVFRLCLGCEMYLLIRRLLPATTSNTNQKEVVA